MAAGAIARKVVPGLSVRGALTQIGPYEIDRGNWDWNEVGNNPFFCPDAKTARVWAEFLDQVRKKGSSAGAVIEIVAEGVPPGLGAPVYGKLDQDIASGLMSINAVRGRDRRWLRLRSRGRGKTPTNGCEGRTPEFFPTMPRHSGGISHGAADRSAPCVKPCLRFCARRSRCQGHDTEISTKGATILRRIRAVPIVEGWWPSCSRPFPPRAAAARASPPSAPRCRHDLDRGGTGTDPRNDAGVR